MAVEERDMTSYTVQWAAVLFAVAIVIAGHSTCFAQTGARIGSAVGPAITGTINQNRDSSPQLGQTTLTTPPSLGSTLPSVVQPNIEPVQPAQTVEPAPVAEPVSPVPTGN